MSLNIPEYKIQEIRNAVDIADFVSGYVTLKKKGENHFGLCPFHSEKTPSFSVNVPKQIFHCFGCGAGGNVFTFVMQHAGVGFMEALRTVAGYASIELSVEETDEVDAEQNDALYHINEFAAKKFQSNLLSDAGKPVVRYLIARGLTKEIAVRFGLGYATPGWVDLLNAALKEDYEKELLTAAGLLVEKEDGSYYDRFRNRVTFPIMNLSGKVVGFGGRALEKKEGTPKYLNSSETPIYDKRNLLYGLYQNRRAISKAKCAVIVEGYMDLLLLQVYGINNVVATLGTALTEGQAALLRRYTDTAIIMYDGDSAGLRATMRGGDALVSAGLTVKVAALPDGHDPDTFVRRVGTEEVTSHIAQAKNLFDVKLAQIQALPHEDRKEGVEGLLLTLSKIDDKLAKGILVSKVAQVLNINEKDLWASMYKVPQGVFSTPAFYNRVHSHSIVVSTKGDRILRDIVRILIRDWSYAEAILTKEHLEGLNTSVLYSLIAYFKLRFEQDVTPGEEDMLNYFTRDAAFTEYIVNELHLLRVAQDNLNLAEWVEDCMAAAYKEAIDLQLTKLRAEVRTNKDNQELCKTLLERIVALTQKKAAYGEVNTEIGN